DQTTRDILNHVTPQADPQLVTALFASLSGSRNPQTGASLVAHWPNLTPKGKSAAIEVLMRRPEWTTAMLNAIGDGAINRSSLAADKWLTLSQHANVDIKRLADSVQGATSSPDKQALIEQFMPAAQAKGDVAAGRKQFIQNCLACHRVGNQGGLIGPNLNGFGQRPKPEILAEIIDPNRSVEMTYQLWTVSTRDGQTLAGKLQSESKTAIELLDIAGQLHVVQRGNILSMTASNLSLMPPGLEQALGEEGMRDLLEFLSTLK
ncbi:MAG: c-type cytochrome, partial [Planctomycetota bacterium]